jgi:hypothetical protein
MYNGPCDLAAVDCIARTCKLLNIEFQRVLACVYWHQPESSPILEMVIVHVELLHRNSSLIRSTGSDKMGRRSSQQNISP